MTSTATVLLSCALGLVLLTPGDRASTSLRGRVVDPDNKALPGVIIKVYWDGNTTRTSTDVNGVYRLDFDAQHPIAEVFYDAAAYRLDHIQGLAAGTSHVIDKVLYPRTSALAIPLLPTLSSLSAYESIQYVSRELKTEPLDKETLARYRQALQQIVVPKEARTRVDQVRTQWQAAPPQ
jgi:hypothetical protein